MIDRRSMTQALKMTPKELDFIKNGPPTIAQITVASAPYEIAERPVEPPTLVPAQSETTSPGDTAYAEKGVRPKRDRVPHANAKHSAPLTIPVVPITIRLKQATAEALRRAALESKLAGHSPSSQQEIVETAIAAWLKQNGRD